jgi:hypothetical protein
MWLICPLYKSKYSNLKLAEAIMEMGLGSIEEVWRDEPIWVIIHISMEQHKKSPCITIFISKLCFSLYIIYFSSRKLENKRVAGQVLPGGISVGGGWAN